MGNFAAGYLSSLFLFYKKSKILPEHNTWKQLPSHVLEIAAASDFVSPKTQLTCTNAYENGLICLLNRVSFITSFVFEIII